MTNLKEIRELHTMANLEGKLIEEEAFLLLELNKSNNLDLNYSNRA